MIVNPSRLCHGFPEGYECLVDVPKDVIYCNGCRLRRQEELAFGLHEVKNPTGIRLRDFDGVELTCECGGDATANLHKFSLLHRRYEWERSGLNPPLVGHGEPFTP